jgi:hydrogenase expression/formation protein HypC
MCLSIPARIIRIDLPFAVVTAGGNEFRVGVHLLSKPEADEYVLVHAGFAIQKIDQAEAEQTLDLIREMGINLAKDKEYDENH